MTNGKNYALITGGSMGIGFELAKLFARDGYGIIIVARDEAELETAATELKKHNVPVVTISKDLMEPEAAFEVYEEIKSQGLTVDVLVNNASQGQYGEFIETDIRRELDMIRLNIDCYLIFGKLYLKEFMQRGGGKILNVASIASKLPAPLQSVYHASKAFVLSWSEAIRFEVKDHNITVTALMPGVTDTDFFNKAEMTESKMVKEGSMADPADVAKDGYEALMAGDDKVISGMKNKAQVAMANMMPDSAVAANMYQQSKPSDK